MFHSNKSIGRGRSMSRIGNERSEESPERPQENAGRQDWSPIPEYKRARTSGASRPDRGIIKSIQYTQYTSSRPGETPVKETSFPSVETQPSQVVPFPSVETQPSTESEIATRSRSSSDATIRPGNPRPSSDATPRSDRSPSSSDTAKPEPQRSILKNGKHYTPEDAPSPRKEIRFSDDEDGSKIIRTDHLVPDKEYYDRTSIKPEKERYIDGLRESEIKYTTVEERAAIKKFKSSELKKRQLQYENLHLKKLGQEQKKSFDLFIRKIRDESKKIPPTDQKEEFLKEGGKRKDQFAAMKETVRAYRSFMIDPETFNKFRVQEDWGHKYLSQEAFQHIGQIYSILQERYTQSESYQAISANTVECRKNFDEAKNAYNRVANSGPALKMLYMAMVGHQRQTAEDAYNQSRERQEKVLSDWQNYAHQKRGELQEKGIALSWL